MPRKKISIEQAFQVLEDAGIQVQVKSVKEEPVPVKVQHPDIFKNKQQSESIVQKINNTTAKIKLFAKHSIGSGGFLTNGPDGRQIEHAGVQTYGPGICDVPMTLVDQLLYADAAARAADERMLEKEQRSYLITQRISSSGQRANVGVQVPNEILDGGLGNLSYDLMYVVRGG